jgi:hypothetical protein
MAWKNLDKTRKIRSSNSGLTIIAPKQNEEAVPVSCPVCRVFFSSNLDLASYRNSKCCSFCETKYAYLDRDSWMTGTRPSRKDIMRDLEERKLLKIKIKF